MSHTTIGKIITRPTDDRRRLIWDSLRPLRWRGYEPGLFIVELDEDNSIKVDLTSLDVSVLHQIEAVLERIVETNHAIAVEMTGSCDIDELLDVAWSALGPVRTVGYGGGEFSLRMPGEFILRYRLTRWDGRIAQRFDELLDRISSENQETMERVLALEPTSTAA